MATRTTSPPTPSSTNELNELEDRIKALESRYSTVTAPPAMPVAPEKPNNHWVSNLLQGVTLITIVGFAFWLGTLSTNLRQNTEKVDKMYSVVLESKDSISARLAVIETKLDAIDKRLAEATITASSARQSKGK